MWSFDCDVFYCSLLCDHVTTPIPNSPVPNFTHSHLVTLTRNHLFVFFPGLVHALVSFL